MTLSLALIVPEPLGREWRTGLTSDLELGE